MTSSEFEERLTMLQGMTDEPGLIEQFAAAYEQLLFDVNAETDVEVRRKRLMGLKQIIRGQFRFVAGLYMERIEEGKQYECN